MPPVVRRLAPGLTLTLALVAGCGGAQESGPGPAADTLAPVAAVRAAADTTQEAGSARIALTSDTQVGEQTLSFTGEGAFDPATRTGTLRLDVPAAGGTIEQRLLGDTVYLALPQEPDVFYELDLEALVGTSLGGNSDPTASFETLRGVSDDVREVGTESVRGTQTTHYSGTYDVQAALEQTEGVTRTLLESSIGRLGLSTVPFDVFLDEQGRVRKLEQVLTLPASEQTGGKEVTSRTTVEAFDFGTAVEVTAPPAEQVKDGAPLLEALQGAGGGAGPGPGQPG